MFTGLIEEVGTVVGIDGSGGGSRLTVQADEVVRGMSEGDSVAVDGVCLTAVDVGRTEFVADVSPETISRTNLVYYQLGTAVNLERPLAAGARLGGHFVQGHVDATLAATSAREEGDFVWLTLAIPPGLGGYVVEKGSVAINGVSLTIARLREEDFDVQLVPHTLARTNLTAEQRSEFLNLEVDILGKYVARLLSERLAGAAAGGETSEDDDGDAERGSGEGIADLVERKFIHLPGD